MSNLNLSGIDLSSIDLSKLDLSSIFNRTKTNDTQEEPQTTAEEPQVIEDKQTQVQVTKATKDKAKTTTVKKITQTTPKTFTITRANDTTVLYQGDNIVTLEELDKIFGSSFTNGQLVLYIDGEVVFNGTVSDDLSAVIFEILEKFLGEHNIKVEFTDGENNTQTFEENVIIS
ncbi:MAG: hypothetical protein BZ137_04305 [Methanosphaera sp. rholeuAM130]|nr:MAG: hypothetical protein BZ137_04305 [Methanosphaera sp. rholeuAM130]